MSPSQSTLARYFSYVHTVDYQTTSVQIVHRLSNDVEIFPHFFILTLSLNLNTLYLTIRRYDVTKASLLFVTCRPLSHSTLTHRLPLRLTQPTVTQFFTITYQNFHQSPARCTHPSTGNHCIADPQTKIQTYSTTKKQTIHHHYNNTCSTRHSSPA